MCSKRIPLLAQLNSSHEDFSLAATPVGSLCAHTSNREHQGGPASLASWPQTLPSLGFAHRTAERPPESARTVVASPVAESKLPGPEVTRCRLRGRLRGGDVPAGRARWARGQGWHHCSSLVSDPRGLRWSCSHEPPRRPPAAGQHRGHLLSSRGPLRAQFPAQLQPRRRPAHKRRKHGTAGSCAPQRASGNPPVLWIRPLLAARGGVAA